MNTRTLLLTTLIVAGAITTMVALSTRLPRATADNPQPDQSEVAKLVEKELARQLPPLVKKEVEAQLAEIERRNQAELQARYADALKAARYDSLLSALQTLRSQIELFKIQHKDRYPTLTQIKDWQILLQSSDADMNLGERKTFGPYLQSAPINPYTEKSAVVAPQNASIEAGWTYNEKTGELRAIIPESELSKRKNPAHNRFTPIP